MSLRREESACYTVLVDIDDRADDGGNGYGAEYCTGLGGVETIVGRVDKRDGGESQVENGPGEGDPQREEEDDRLEEKGVVSMGNMMVQM